MYKSGIHDSDYKSLSGGLPTAIVLIINMYFMYFGRINTSVCLSVNNMKQITKKCTFPIYIKVTLVQFSDI